MLNWLFALPAVFTVSRPFSISSFGMLKINIRLTLSGGGTYFCSRSRAWLPVFYSRAFPSGFLQKLAVLLALVLESV
jgi:hypothetical protein